jgi:hypothetical protein
MKANGIPFSPGAQKISKGIYEKRYHPYLYRLGQRRYAGHGKLNFRTATEAFTYAVDWALRAEQFLIAKKAEHVN